MFQERHGWERPGWFSSSPAGPLPYDWYGAYEHTPEHEDHQYKKLLNDDYSFDFPAHHHQACTINLVYFFFSFLVDLVSLFFRYSHRHLRSPLGNASRGSPLLIDTSVRPLEMPHMEVAGIFMVSFDIQ